MTDERAPSGVVSLLTEPETFTRGLCAIEDRIDAA